MCTELTLAVCERRFYYFNVVEIGVEIQLVVFSCSAQAPNAGHKIYHCLTSAHEKRPDRSETMDWTISTKTVCVCVRYANPSCGDRCIVCTFVKSLFEKPKLLVDNVDSLN